MARKIKAEIRADGLHIVGYVNVPGRESDFPVMTSKGKAIEVIEQRAFQRAIDKADNIDLKVDHERSVASTKEGNLTLGEDAVGLRASAHITDTEVVEAAKQGKLKGWSFNMINAVDEIEERADKLPIRRVKDFGMTEITLALRKRPYYSSTSMEFRTEGEEIVEFRAVEESIEVLENKQKTIDYSQFENKIQNLKESR